MRVILQTDDIVVNNVSANAADWTANGTELFEVTYQDTGRGIDITSVGGPAPGLCHLLGIPPSNLLLKNVRKISGVVNARINENQPNILIVEILHRNGSDWETVRPLVNTAIVRFLVPSTRPSVFSRGRRRKVI